MNNKLSGIIFLLFGLGLTFDSIQELASNSTITNIKTVILLLLGISSCIFGFKQIQKGNTSQPKNDE